MTSHSYSSPLINGLLDYLGEEPVMKPDPNMTTVLRQAQVAQGWLLTHYLAAWLELIGGLVDCDYPMAIRHQARLRALSRLAEHIDPSGSDATLAVDLNSIESHLQSVLRAMGEYPHERDLQWGIWSRDVPMSIAYGFDETGFLDACTCRDVARCCMYAAFLVSQVVTDKGVAEEISSKMFGEKPRALILAMRNVPVSPEA